MAYRQLPLKRHYCQDRTGTPLNRNFARYQNFWVERGFCRWGRMSVTKPYLPSVLSPYSRGANQCRAVISYREVPSGVPTAALLPFRAGKCPLVYQPPPCCRFVQESALWCTNHRLAAISCREVPSGVPTNAVTPFRTGTWPWVYRPVGVTEAVR